MPTCRLCNQQTYTTVPPLGVCQACHEKLALPPRTEPLRPRIPCARCHHTSFVRCHVIRERAAHGGDVATEYIAPLAATFDFAVRHTFWAGRKVSSPDTGSPIGVFEGYICRGCGYVELYARDAADIPIGDDYGTELFEVGGDAPYR